MSDSMPKWLFLLSLSIACFMIPSHQVGAQLVREPKKPTYKSSDESSPTNGSNQDSSDNQKANIYRNKKGLRDRLTIQGPIKEMSVISKTKTETIEGLIEDISLWIPKMYREQFSINPQCIIILETKINDDEKAEVRFAVAMECNPIVPPTKTIRI